MEAFNCPFCNTSLPLRAIFCKSCTKQVRCKTCKDLLEPDSLVCISCGTRVGEGENLSVVKEPTKPALISNMNTLEFDETRSGRSLRATLTDEAVGHLSDPFGMFIAGRITDRTQRSRQPLSPVFREIITEHDQLPSPVVSESNRQQTDRETVTPNQGHSTDKDKLQRVFRREGEQLRLHESRLKATSKLDAGRRLTYLLLYAYESEGRDSVSREDVTEALRKADLFDSNSSRWIGNSPDLYVDDKNAVSLRQPGQERAREVLEEVFDPEIPNAWTLGTSKVPASGKPKSGNNGKIKTGSQRKNSRRSLEVDVWLNAWNEARLAIDGHSVLKDRSLMDRGIFGLYAIRRVAENEGKIVSRGKLSKFLYEAFELKVDERNLSRALESEGAKGKVLKVTGGYQIQPPGVKYAEQMANMVAAST